MGRTGHLGWMGLLVCLLALPAWGTDWYVRPKHLITTNGDGTAYAESTTGVGGPGCWDGMGNIVWASIQPGDTLYLCGTFTCYDEGLASYLLQLPTCAKNGTANARITISGLDPAHADDPGILIGATKKVAAAAWIAYDPGDGPDGTYYSDFSGAYSQAFEGTIGSSEAVLRKRSSQATVRDTDGSFWKETTTNGTQNRMWYNPHGDTPLDMYYGWAGNVILNRGNDYITYKNLTIRYSGLNGANLRLDSYTGTYEDADGAEHCIIEDCSFSYPDWACVTCGKSRYLTIRNNVFDQHSVGIYVVAGIESPVNFTITGNYFDCNDLGWEFADHGYGDDGVGDRGAMQLQAGPNWVIERNWIKKACSYGILIYRNAGNTCADLSIRYNRIDQVGEKEGTFATAADHGICLSGTATKLAGSVNWPDGEPILGFTQGFARAVIAHNVVANCGQADILRGYDFIGCGIRTRAGTPEAADRIQIYNNTVSNCNFSFFVRQDSNDYGQGVVFQNNISQPRANGYHAFWSYLPNPSAGNPVLGYNCWNPDTSTAGGFFAWNSSASLRITAFTDLGGTPNRVQATTNLGHGRTNGDVVVIGAGVYLGAYAITVVNSTNFSFEHAWGGDDAAGRTSGNYIKINLPAASYADFVSLAAANSVTLDAATGAGGHTLLADPLLLDVGNLDVRLGSGSPAIGAGVLVSPITGVLLRPEQHTDAFWLSGIGTADYRFYGAAVPLGAWNYGKQRVLLGF